MFKKVGSIRLQSTVDVTDPYYRKDVWCRCTLDNMVPGDYECFFNSRDEGHWGIRISRARIVRKDDNDAAYGIKNRTWEEVAEIGVDAGMAGFFQDKPDFTDEDWDDFINGVDPGGKFCVAKYNDVYLANAKNNSQFRNKTDGFWTASGYGDGEYAVYGIFNAAHTHLVALELRFL